MLFFTVQVMPIACGNGCDRLRHTMVKAGLIMSVAGFWSSNLTKTLDEVA
jgi:hypothetical protein